jgi:hypothetical protein
MSAISPISSAATQTAIATASLPSDTVNTSSQTASSSASQPAVIVSLSSAEGGTQNPVFAQPLSDQVSRELNLVAGANAEANLAAGFKANGYANDAAKFGVAIANRDLAEAQGNAAQLAQVAIAGAAGLGIQVQDSVSPDAVAKGATPGTLSISAFSFTSAGNKYAVTPGTNGSFIESENGQTLYSFQGRTPNELSTGSIADAGALQAVATLNAVAAKSTADSDSSKLSVLA